MLSIAFPESLAEGSVMRCVPVSVASGLNRSSCRPTWPIGSETVRLSATDIHVWSADLDVPSEKFWSLLTNDEQGRVERFHFPADRSRFIVARGVLRTLLGRYLEIPAGDVQICYGSFKKPALSDCHRSDLQFSVAHSGNLAVYAFSRSRRVGLDLESLECQRQPLEGTESYLSPQERKAIAAIPASRRLLTLLILWTCKEAYLKALGCGLQEDPSNIEISLAAATPTLVRGVDEDRKENWSFCHLEPPGAYVGTLCVENDGEIKLWSPSPSEHYPK